MRRQGAPALAGMAGPPLAPLPGLARLDSQMPARGGCPLDRGRGPTAPPTAGQAPQNVWWTTWSGRGGAA